MVNDRRREVRILTDWTVSYPLTLLQQGKRILRRLDQGKDVEGVDNLLSRILEPIELIRSLIDELPNYEPEEANDRQIEELASLAFWVAGTVHLLDRMRRLGDHSDLDSLFNQLWPRVERIVSELTEIREELSKESTRLVVMERAAMENIPYDDAFEKEMERWK